MPYPLGHAGAIIVTWCFSLHESLHFSSRIADFVFPWPSNRDNHRSDGRQHGSVHGHIMRLLKHDGPRPESFGSITPARSSSSPARRAPDAARRVLSRPQPTAAGSRKATSASSPASCVDRTSKLEGKAYQKPELGKADAWPEKTGKGPWNDATADRDAPFAPVEEVFQPLKPVCCWLPESSVSLACEYHYAGTRASYGHHAKSSESRAATSHHDSRPRRGRGAIRSRGGRGGNVYTGRQVDDG